MPEMLLSGYQRLEPFGPEPVESTQQRGITGGTSWAAGVKGRGSKTRAGLIAAMWVLLGAIACSSGHRTDDARPASNDDPEVSGSSNPEPAATDPDGTTDPNPGAASPTVAPAPTGPRLPTFTGGCDDGVVLDAATDADAEGNFVLRGVSPIMSGDRMDCAATDPYPEAAGAVVVKLEIPRDGEYTFMTASPSVTMLSVQDQCGPGRETYSYCSELPYYLHPSFLEVERRVTIDAQQGQIWVVVAGSSTGEAIDLFVVTPALDGERCGLLPELGVERSCATSVCDGPLQICGPGTAPSIEQALAWVGEDRLSLRLSTSDLDADVDPAFVRVRLLDAAGNELEAVESRGAEPKKSDSWVSVESQDEPVILRADLHVEPGVLARVTRCAVTVSDSQGQLSAEVELPVEPRALLNEGELCDTWAASDVCPPGHVCMQDPIGEHVCLSWSATAVRNEDGAINVRVQVPDASADSDGGVNFYVEDSLFPLEISPAPPRWGETYYWASTDPEPPFTARGEVPASGWERKHVLFGTGTGYGIVPEELLARFDPPTAGGPLVLPVGALTEIPLGERCDGARLMDRCEPGSSCMSEQDGRAFACRGPSAPEIVSVQWVMAGDSWGFIIDGRDADGDAASVWIDAVGPDGEVTAMASRDLDGVRELQEFSAAEWFGYFVGTNLRIHLVDQEGLASNTVTHTLVETGPIVGTIDSFCDVGGTAVLCEPGTLCTYSDAGPVGFRCLDMRGACPESWNAEDIELPEAPPLRLESSTANAMHLGIVVNRYGAANVAYRFEAPVSATYDFWATGTEGVEHAVEVRTACTLPSTEILPGNRYNSPNDSANGSGVDLEAGDVVYPLVGAATVEGGDFELFITWSAL